MGPVAESTEANPVRVSLKKAAKLKCLPMFLWMCHPFENGLFCFQSFEAWNNLARCYVMLEEHEKAWNIFQEAAKRNYDNCEIWDNVLTISAKCGHFDAVSQVLFGHPPKKLKQKITQIFKKK